MRKLTILIVLTFVVSLLHGTDVAGEVSGTWSSEYSPYRVTGNIIVPASGALVISHGVHVVFQGNFQITVQGRIEVNGTKNDSVRIYGVEGVVWESIRLETGNRHNVFEHCVITNAKTGINNTSSSMDLKNSRLGYMEDTAVNIFGSSTSPFVVITSTKIHDTDASGITITDYLNVQIYDSVFTRCSRVAMRGAIHISQQTSLSSS